MYKSIKDNKGPKKTGRGAQSYLYFEKLDEILGAKPSNTKSKDVIDVGISCDDNYEAGGSENENEKREGEAVVDTQSSDSTKTDVASCPSGWKNRKDKFLIEKEKNKQKRHDERMHIERERLALEKQKIDALLLLIGKGNKIPSQEIRTENKKSENE